ncbi:ABC transporter substrate-binding protein [Halopiger goleimassiliensis]|uniref:ABC transporter substrate-binding protein n=1 Tax=Halopiger goleimassiliensis TaxID=1293048 RepID=UPI0006780916|nr:ABC transporter substrate-binding protein [Halopiger goleimassiliensis]
MVTDPNYTRRTLLRTGAVVAGTGVLAGCTSEEGNGDGNGDGDETTGNGTGDGNGNGNGDDDTTDEDTDGNGDDAGGHTASIEPVGTVEFDAVPETWVADNGTWADMGVALGQDPPEGLWLTGRYHTQYYDEIPGLEVSRDGMIDLYDDGVDLENFYEIDADVHVMDPNFMENRYSDTIDEDDIDAIENLGPIFGSTIFSRDYQWRGEYEYYTLYEAFERLADVFQEQARYDAFESLHDEFQSRLAEHVSGEEPEVGVLWPMEDDEFLPYSIDEGTSFKHLNDLGVDDAIAAANISDFHDSRGRIDYEDVLEIDPDVLLLRGHEHLTTTEFEETVLADLKNHNIASNLTAVQNDDVYQAGPLHQGPIINLVVTERTAQQLYDVDEQLFDRERVGEIVTGDL